ncbi:MAG: nucleoside deaminase [Clostridiales bacterium]|nr:tRNA adenosine(34) deaminase TadA [Bacillota bacterium]NLL53651.1 nucleoside deaminase [Clostridiales bacterium]
MREDAGFMEEALAEARTALLEGELPVGAVVVYGDKIIARAHNEREQSHDPTAHAEILALRRAAKHLGNWRLTGCTLYVTLEPCPMCAGAIVQARVDRLVYGAPDEGSGCAGSVYRITEDPAFTHFTPADGGILSRECRALLDQFFQNKRDRP